MYFIINILQTNFKDENQWYSTFINVIFFFNFTTRNINGQKKKDKRQEEFEDTKGVIRSHKSKKDRQHNGKKKKDKKRLKIPKG